MKKILTLAAMVAGFAFGANAQRTCDLEVFFTSPADGTTTNCVDSIQFRYGMINNGPDMVLPTDTIVFLTPLTDSGYISYIAGDTILANDTVFLNSFKVKPNEITRLFSTDDGTYLFPPYANGTYGMAVEIVQLGFPTPSAAIEDDNSDNDGVAMNIIYNCTTGLNGLTKNNSSLKVFPNPAYNQVSFTNDFAAATTASVRITDIAGRVVKTMNLGKQNAGAKTYNVDIADLNNGMYYIELVTESTRSISKFTKN